MDLLDGGGLCAQNLACLDRLRDLNSSIAVVVGFVEKNPSFTGNPYFNSAALIRNGSIEAVYRKQLLPAYDVFEDPRYFAPGQSGLEFELRGQRFAVTICEDIWNFPRFVERLYATQPLDAVRDSAVDWLINLSASPFHLGKPTRREELFVRVSGYTRAGLLFCNQVGANDDLIFDGGSSAVSAQGKRLIEPVYFEESLLLVDTQTTQPVSAPQVSDACWLMQALVLGIRDYCDKTQSKGVCLGLSGGIDSSVVASLAVQALGKDRVLGVLLPSEFTSAASNEDALALASALGIQTKTLSIVGVLREASAELRKHGEVLAPLTQENLQPRLRMALLMALANERGYLLLNTSNKSEIATGYATLYGDSAGALGVLGDLTKDQVFDLAREINLQGEKIPQRVLTRPPSAELRPNQKDEDSLPPYAILDPMVRAHVERGAGKAELTATAGAATPVEKFLALFRSSEFKRRQSPPILRVSARAFGRGRRVPVVAKQTEVASGPPQA